MAKKTQEELEQENRELRAHLKKTTNALKVAEATKPKNAKPIFEDGGESYEVVSGELRKGKRTSREDLAKDRARCKELVAAGSGLLRKVVIK